MTRQAGNFDGSRGRRSDAGRTQGGRSGAPRGGAGQGRGGSGSRDNNSYGGSSSYGSDSRGERSYGSDSRGEGGSSSRGERSYGERSYGSDSRGSDSRGQRGSSNGGGRSYGSGQGGSASRGDSRGERSYGSDSRGQGGSSSGGYGKSSSGKPSYGKPAGGKGGAGKAGAPKAGGARGAANGPRAFSNERFGLDLGPVKRRRKGPRTAVTATPRVENADGERLQKVMAHAGVASRRVCEEMILTGRVEVNGEIVRELGVRVKPADDTVHVDGVRLQLDENMTYFVFNKPAGVVSSMKDPDGRRDISSYLREGQSERLYHVGRLDFETEGLLLLTNDGELAHRLTHPSFEVPKTYYVQIRGPLPMGVGAQLRDGIELEDGIAKVDSFRLIDSTPGQVLVEVVLHSGKNRIVRRMFDAVGFPVQRLVRVQIGPIRLGDQRQGSLRKLGKQEVGHLLAEVGL